ncbi:MAG: hypothetical protein B7X90_01720 [Novosphingobium sp. 17-62-19]|uniref:hypothetical protein n=1 Tax=Novosphingobium sp. 17-62-19 TaxID=1970406 RepID=UPI000BC51119|nr:hypothetical protein [Novosphingobium sp. 17-62-19]OYX95022.1 MAG: hypothetical protein B7Y74_05445 [Novosphingobium sp. 35-62-5]OZA21355.1 MAG: hypothetical protein B7X90_01720 [Novosphingobium sp. 17-62-19]HQS95101.1 hypothetical protein [Novosphingobium sp.]
MNWIRANLWRAVATAALAAAAALALWIFGAPIIGGGLLSNLDRVTQLREAEASSHRTTKANIRAAQASATAAQAAVNQQPALTSANIAEISDATAPAYYDAVQRAAADRVRPGRSAAQCAGSVADLPGTDRATASDVEDAGPAGLVSDADSVLVRRSDWTKIIAAAGQAAMCARAGQELIRRGVAVPGPPSEELGGITGG